MIRDKISRMEYVEKSLNKVIDGIEKEKSISWDNVIDIIKVVNVQKDWSTQYITSKNFLIILKII